MQACFATLFWFGQGDRSDAALPDLCFVGVRGTVLGVPSLGRRCVGELPLQGVWVNGACAAQAARFDAVQAIAVQFFGLVLLRGRGKTQKKRAAGRQVGSCQECLFESTG